MEHWLEIGEYIKPSHDNVLFLYHWKYQRFCGIKNEETNKKQETNWKKDLKKSFQVPLTFSFQIFYFAPILFFIMVLCKSSGVTMFFQKLVNPSKSSVQKFDMHGMSKQKNHTLSYLMGWNLDNNTHNYVSNGCFDLHQVLNSPFFRL